MTTEPAAKTGTLYGYARVSTRDQNLDLQAQALAAAGVKPAHLVAEKMSGAVDRPRLNALLAKLKPGDTLAVWKADRLGRSALATMRIMAELDARGVRLIITTVGLDSGSAMGRMVLNMLMSFAEFERDLIIERTQAGLEAARRRGRVGGRPSKLTPHQREQAREMLKAGESMRDIAKLMNVSATAIWRLSQPAR